MCRRSVETWAKVNVGLWWLDISPVFSLHCSSERKTVSGLSIANMHGVKCSPATMKGSFGELERVSHFEKPTEGYIQYKATVQYHWTKSLILSLNSELIWQIWSCLTVRILNSDHFYDLLMLSPYSLDPRQYPASPCSRPLRQVLCWRADVSGRQGCDRHWKTAGAF